MTPKIACGKCGNPISDGDRFCGACGTPVEWNAPRAAQPASAAPSAQSAGDVRCPLCGQQNPAGALTCTSCGNALPGRKGATAPAAKKPVPQKGHPTKQAPLTFFQSWKFIAMIGAILVVAVILYKNYQPTAPNVPATQSPAMSPNAAEAIERIETLQRAVDANPKDADQTLRLANALHDVRMFPRAAAMYARYLQLVPTNPDARVDLGTTYFELSMTDTSRQAEYLNSARMEMEKALTYAPRHQLAHFNLGIISLHAGNMEQATRWFSKCAAIDSTTDAGKRANQLLHQHTLTNTQ
jgi:cytochrome c-type biogenesis protein CcmH/NrfG